MTNQDEQVARAIEDKPDTLVGKHGTLSEKRAWDLNFYMGRDENFFWYPRPFISSPTCCTERVVLEWVSWSEYNDKVEVWLASKEIGHMEYKLGDYAKALLEVLDAD